VNDESDLQRSKHRSQRISTEAGMQIDCNDEQWESASASIRVSFDPDSKVIDEIPQQCKQNSLRILTEAGMQIDCNDEQWERACASIRASFAPDSKINIEIELHQVKHPLDKISISRFSVIIRSLPKYRITEGPSQLTKRLPERCKWRFPASIVIIEILVDEKAKPLIFSSATGRQMNCKEQQRLNVSGPISVN
jgi:hypothetical protein